MSTKMDIALPNTRFLYKHLSIYIYIIYIYLEDSDKSKFNIENEMNKSKLKEIKDKWTELSNREYTGERT